MSAQSIPRKKGCAFKIMLAELGTRMKTRSFAYKKNIHLLTLALVVHHMSPCPHSRPPDIGSINTPRPTRHRHKRRLGRPSVCRCRYRHQRPTPIPGVPRALAPCPHIAAVDPDPAADVPATTSSAEEDVIVSTATAAEARLLHAQEMRASRRDESAALTLGYHRIV